MIVNARLSLSQRRKEGRVMSVFEALTLMISFSLFVLALISAIIGLLRKK